MSGAKIVNADQSFLSRLYFSLFLWKIEVGELKTAQGYLVEGINLNPLLLIEQQEKLLQFITSWALRQSHGQPLALAQLAVDNLPVQIRQYGRLQRRVLGTIHIAQAFDKYATGDVVQTRRHIFKGLGYDPSFIKNRGVLAILAKSFLKKQISSVKLTENHVRSDESALQSVISEVETALGCSVDNIRHIPLSNSQPMASTFLTSDPIISVTKPSTSRLSNKYFIKAGGQPYMLRLVERDDLEKRIAVVEYVRAVGVPAPAIIAYAPLSATNNRFVWLLEEWRSGMWFDPHQMSPADELAHAADLGQHLRRLHTIKAKAFGRILSASLDASYETFTAWLDSRQQVIERGCMIGAISTATFPALAATFRFLGESYTESPVLCHCDLTHGNIFVDSKRVTTIIDWEDAEGGDPAYDIAVFMTRMSVYWHLSKKSTAILNSMLQAYGADEPVNFYRRVIAHRFIFAATEVTRLLGGDEEEYLNACQAILTDTKLVFSTLGVS